MTTKKKKTTAPVVGYRPFAQAKAADLAGRLPVEHDWRLASSGVSVDAGPVRIRMEAAGTREERAAIAEAISRLPSLLAARERLDQEGPDGAGDGSANRPTHLLHVFLANDREHDARVAEMAQYAVDAALRGEGLGVGLEAITSEAVRARIVERAHADLAEQLREFVESLAEEAMGVLVAHRDWVSDLLNFAVGRVDWFDLAERWIRRKADAAALAIATAREGQEALRAERQAALEAGATLDDCVERGLTEGARPTFGKASVPASAISAAKGLNARSYVKALLAGGANADGGKYVGRIWDGEERIHFVGVDGSEVELDPRYDLANHSPSGLSWGYAGSGPAQASLAILAHRLGVAKRKKPAGIGDARSEAEVLYQAFKRRVLVGLDKSRGFELPVEEVDAYLRSLRAELQEREVRDA